MLNENTLSKETCDILHRAPIRLLLTNVQLDELSLVFCAQNGIRVVYTPDLDPDPFVAVQQALDKALEYDGDERQLLRHDEHPKIVNVLPDGLDQQLLLGHYYSLRRDTAKVGDRFTVPARNVFIQARSLPDRRYAELLQSASFVRILGTQSEVGVEIEQWLAQFGRTTRHSFDNSPDSIQATQALLASHGLHLANERIASDSIMSRLISFFANHDYALTRLAIEGLLDPKHSPSAAFSAAIEKVTGQRSFWNVSLELIQEYGKLEIFGPPFSVIIPTSEWGDNAIFNAVLGAQYAKALRACLFPLYYLSETNQRTIRHTFKELCDQVYSFSENRAGWHEIEGNLKVISSELINCFDTPTKLTLRPEEFSGKVRPTYGQYGIYIFHSDYSLPIELVSCHEAFGRSNTLGTLTLFGRMAFKSPQQTALYGAENVLYQQSWYPSNTQVVLASDPTGDLLGSGVFENSSICIALGRVGITPKLLTGLNKSVLFEEKVRLLPMPDSGPYRVIESAQDEHGNLIDEYVYEFDPPMGCTVDNFIAAVTESGGVHFTGHGEIHQQSPELVLADGNLSFNEFPHLDGHPWLLLNACELGQANDQAESAMLLLEKGAIQVIAPLLAVKDVVAYQLGELYHWLPIVSLPAAFQLARYDIFLRGKQSTDHLAYVIYGDPFAYQGRKLWEAYDAHHCYIVAWQQTAIKEKYHLYNQETYLFRLAAKEAQLRADASSERYWREQTQFFSQSAAASSGAFYALIADALPSSQQRLEYLSKAIDAYLSAAQKRTGPRFNLTLMLAYGMQIEATLQIESVTLSFLDGRFTTDQLRKEFRGAIERLHKAEAEFREIGDNLDANNCVALREELQSIVQMPVSESSRPQLESALKALLHTAKGELAQNPPLLSELAEAQRASATAKQAQRSKPQLESSPVSLRGFFSAESFKHTDVGLFLGEFLDSIQFLTEMHSKLYRGQLAPSDFQELANATSRLNPYHNRDRAQMLVNNALLKQISKHWLYDDPNFQRQLPKELPAKLIGFSGLFANLDTTKVDIDIIRGYTQTYFDLFWEGKQGIYIALDEGKRLSLKQVDEIMDNITGLKIDRNGQLEINARFRNLYKVHASVDVWADFYTCMLFEEQFRIPASQRFRLGQTEFSMRFGIGGIIDISSIALLVKGQNEDFFFSELEKLLTGYLSTRVNTKSFTHRIDALVALQRSRSTEDFIALDDALTRLGIGHESWSVLQSRGIAISIVSTKEQEQKLARRLNDASNSVYQLIRQRFR